MDRLLRAKQVLYLALFSVFANLSSAATSEPDPLQIALLRVQAVALEHGEGVERNPGRAMELYCEAARLGDADAAYSLGWMFANGRGMPRDDAQAVFLFRTAASQGHEYAEKMMARMVSVFPVEPECFRAVASVELSEHDLQPAATVDLAATGAPQKIVDLVVKLAPEYGIQPLFVLAVMKAESNFDLRAVSPRNAQGLMQLIPETAKRFNVKDAFDPEQNVRGGLSYLRWLLAYFRGRVPLVLAGYNAGEKAVVRYRGIPPYPETRDYVRRVMRLFRSETHSYPDGVAGLSDNVLNTF